MSEKTQQIVDAELEHKNGQNKRESDYSAESITVLEGLEAVRLRPAMYIGDISARGLHHLVYEVVDNCIDEALAGYCKNIQVTIHPDNSITVVDDGRGIPTGMMAKEKKSALEVVLTVLHAGGKFNKDTYKVSGGLHGVGVSCVNALSTKLVATVQREGKIFTQEFSKGKPLGEVKVIGTSDKTGTSINFLPDNTIFTESVYSFSTLSARLRELAYLNKGVTLSITDEREKNEKGEFVSDTFLSQGGLKEFVMYLDENREKLLAEPLYMESESKYGMPVEVAMIYNSSFSENIHSYVNNINTHEGGTHLAGFRRALTRTLKSYAEKSGLFSKLKFELTVMISVKG
jgi:DNA gyrase subunit B